MSKEKKRKIIDDKNKEGMVYFEIWGILLILLAIIILSELGPVGVTLNRLAKIIFGDWYWLILCFMFYYGTLMIVYHEFISYSSIKMKGIIFISCGLLIFTHFPVYNYLASTIAAKHSNIITQSYNLYLSYINTGTTDGVYGGGLLGAALFWASSLLLGSIGTQIIAIILLISGIAYLFEKTVYDFVDDLYFGLIKSYKVVHNYIKTMLGKMANAQVPAAVNEEVTEESVSMKDEPQAKFENINVTKNDRIEVPKKYSKPNIKTLKYHENKGILENQKDITIENAKIINEVLKAFYLNLEISEIYLGPTISTYIIDTDNSLKSKKILSHKEELISRLDSSNTRIYEKYENKHCVYVEVPNRYRYLISLREILEEDENGNSLPIGRDFSGKLFYLDLRKNPNILVIGHDINSKIAFLQSLVNTIVYKFQPEEFKLVLCDSTKFELNEFSEIPHLFYDYISEFISLKPFLIKLYTEVEQRLSKLAENKQDFTPILLILNDFTDFYHNNNDYLKYLNYVLVYGGKVNVYTIFATTNMDELIITNNLRAQFNCIVSFLINNKEISFKYLEDDATKLLKEGDSLVFDRESNKIRRVQMINPTHDDKLA